MVHEGKFKNTRKVSFNCPLSIHKAITTKIRSGVYSTQTDAILTALREKFVQK